MIGRVQDAPLQQMDAESAINGLFIIEHPAQFFKAVEHPRAECDGLGPDDVFHLGITEVLEDTHDDDFALVAWEAIQGGQDTGDFFLFLGIGGHMARLPTYLNTIEIEFRYVPYWTSFSSPGLIDGQIAGNGEYPGAKALGIAVSCAESVSAEENLLGDGFDVFEIAEHPVEIGQNGGAVSLIDNGEGALVAALGKLHEMLIGLFVYGGFGGRGRRCGARARLVEDGFELSSTRRGIGRSRWVSDAGFCRSLLHPLASR